MQMAGIISRSSSRWWVSCMSGQPCSVYHHSAASYDLAVQLQPITHSNYAEDALCCTLHQYLLCLLLQLKPAADKFDRIYLVDVSGMGFRLQLDDIKIVPIDLVEDFGASAYTAPAAGSILPVFGNDLTSVSATPSRLHFVAACGCGYPSWCISIHCTYSFCCKHTASVRQLCRIACQAQPATRD